jgi:glycosyltransferase involved in cell wall biosynthesis
VVVAAGRLDPSKGHLLLFDAFARVVQKCPDARLLVCGWATYPGYDTVLKQRVTHLGLDGSVVFAGTRPDMPGIYAGADVFCLPTVDDACPLVFLEAMAAGLPTVGVVSGGVPEMVVDGATGLLSAPGDASALATSLLTLLRDPSLRARLGNAGKERVQEVFAPRRAAAEWMTVLHRLLPHVAGRTARRTRTRPAAPGQLHPLAV